MAFLSDLLAPDWSAFAAVDMWVRIAVQLLLLCGSAFFSGSETALFGLSRVDLQQIRRSGHPSSGIIHTLLDEPRQLIISILCGNELVNVAASTNMTAIVARLYGFEAAAMVTSFIMVPLILLLAEVTPKTVAVSNPIKVSTAVVAPALARWVGVIAPVTAVVRLVADRLTTWIAGPQKSSDGMLRVDEFRTLIDEGAMKGQLSDVEHALIYNLLDAGNTEVLQIMTPRTRAAFFDAERPLPELLASFVESCKKRAPVYRGDKDHVIGELRIEDVVARRRDGGSWGDASLPQLLRPVVSVVDTLTVDALLDRMQAADVEAAIVVGEFGETLGVVTMTDVAEFLWGHVYANSRPPVGWPVRASDPIPGAMKLKEFNRLTHLGLQDPRMTTVAGYVMRRLGKVPQAGDQLVVEGHLIEVWQVRGNSIEWLQLRSLPDGSGARDAGEEGG